ncbi:MAG: amidase [Chloroflexi bacterium]|nr:amidase [Chloroflexota bacterium]MBT4073328.1 amidase [Chloroflexota bacterium]MBT4514993.1 amidase [Chloroflexota bacterium]MBT6681534.1 amidase [Chloroflexota bacterium]
MSDEHTFAFIPAHELLRMVAAREVSPVELTEWTLRRIEETNDTLHAYLTVVADQAMESARAAETAVMRGDDLGPLHGLPFPIKDLVPTAGIRTTFGSAVYSDNVPDKDDIVVQRIKAAGAVIVGKTNTPEFGHLGYTSNKLGEDCRNPWDITRESGGSSGGAAASVAAGITPLAQGGDGGGSIRIPASLCGLYGIKGTEGRVPRSGGGSEAAWHPYNLAQSGPLSRNVRDSALLMSVLTGSGGDAAPGTLEGKQPDYLGAMGRGVEGLRIGWTPDMGGNAVDPDVAESTARAAHDFEGLGASVEEFDFEIVPDEMWDRFRNYFDLKALVGYGDLLESSPDLLSDVVREGMEHARTLTAVDHHETMAFIAKARDYFRRLFERYELVLSPTLATTTFKVAEGPPREIGGRVMDAERAYWTWSPFTYSVNITGHPAATVPCGFDRNGLPIGLHIIGGFGGEETVLAASAAFEEVHPWADKRPPNF